METKEALEQRGYTILEHDENWLTGFIIHLDTVEIYLRDLTDENSKGNHIVLLHKELRDICSAINGKCS